MTPWVQSVIAIITEGNVAFKQLLSSIEAVGENKSSIYLPKTLCALVVMNFKLSRQLHFTYVKVEDTVKIIKVANISVTLNTLQISLLFPISL